MSKIGILGGTFNPIHNGHITIAMHAYKELSLDEVYIMPNHHPQYRSIEGVSDEDRSNMIMLATLDYDGLFYSDIEIKREGATYTVDTLRDIKTNSPDDDYYFIMGADSLMYFDKWREPDEIVKLCDILVAVRGEDDMIRCADKINELGYNNITMLKSPNTDISSTDIRNRVRAGMSIDGLVPDCVAEYIHKRRLYI